MKNTPQSNRIHVAIFGETNAGKSALFNAILNSDVSIVSGESPATTDPIKKSMELIPFGPIVLIDTAGINDLSVLGKKREEKTYEILRRTDFAIYASDCKAFSTEKYEETVKMFHERNIEHILVFTKLDLYQQEIEDYLKSYENATAVSVYDDESVEGFKKLLAEKLSDLGETQLPLVSDILKPYSHVVLVIPIDEAAPKGRLILPQVQVLRDLIDNNIFAHVTSVDGLDRLVKHLGAIDLVITDSGVFGDVNKILDKNIPLTSFSIIMARQKGDILAFADGVKAIKNLKENDTVLICENCSHNKTHEDIGQVKIPNILKKIVGKDINIDFKAGNDFPADLEKYQLIIHCGGCMTTRKEMEYRIFMCNQKNIPMTNYGIFLAYASGILDRSLEIFK